MNEATFHKVNEGMELGQDASRLLTFVCECGRLGWVIVVALAAGGVLGGIVGVILAVPVAGFISVAPEYSCDRPPPASPLLSGERRNRLNAPIP